LAKNTNRDEFTPATKKLIERQARGHCSNPMCRRLTGAPASDGSSEINIGQASHICAAAPGGPRYDASMTSEQRRHADNGIWLCDVHGRAVDSKDSKFTVEELHGWKKKTSEDAWRSVMHNVPFETGTRQPTTDQLRERLRTAATVDLAAFRQTAKWPATTVALTLKIDQVEEPLTTRALAEAVATFDDLILVAQPGMGKTTTVFQVAERALELDAGTPLIVPLGDWATDYDSMLASILKRPAFAGLSEADFHTVAAKPSVVLLLDGWNELDAAARERARVQISDLKKQLPTLGLLISTRKQAMDIPFSGTRVDLLPLGNEQQMEIARAMRGEAGERLVDEAWRTAGVRELVTIPLYLTALLSLPEGVPFPNTKEEVLRRFVVAHEQDARRAAALATAMNGFQQHYLDGLAVIATSTANTAITDANARRSVSNTARMLVADGQLTIVTAQPDAMLDTLVSNHVLMRSGDVPGYSFQHQQFQEWYASHHVEELMLQAVGNAAARERLKTEVLNHRPWTEAILFAIERASRSGGAHKAACNAAILAAFEVDPILAADMIYRATADVWTTIGPQIRALVERWHVPGKVDRAVRFMVTSGRPEFGDLLWPLFTHENSQIRLSALRAGRRFRPSVFGNNAAERIAALAPELRKTVLHEIVSMSGMDGLDLATEIAKQDTDPEVKALVVHALSFRRADRHVVDLLSDADDKAYDIVVEKGHIDDLPVESVQTRLKDARARRSAAGVSPRERLRVLLHAPAAEGRDDEIAAVVADMEIDQKRNGELHLLHELRNRYPKGLADGILRRVRANKPLFYGADNILSAAGYVLEDQTLLDIALEESGRRDDRAESAASVLGPQAVGRLIDASLEVRKHIRDANGKYDQAIADRYHGLRGRIAHTPGASLVAAVQERADAAEGEDIVNLADLFSRSEHADEDRARPFSEEDLVAIGALAEKWGARLLASPTAPRWSKAAIATLISHAPSVALLPTLKALLDDNLRLYRTAAEKAKATGWRYREALTEAQHPHMHEYRQALVAIRAPESDAIAAEYLADIHFGEQAASVLAAHWTEANVPKDDKFYPGGVDFTRVEERRAARARNPAETCDAADAIFGAIERLIAEGASDEQNKLAVVLGIAATRLPHAERSKIIDKLVALAPRMARAALLQSLVLSGEEIDIKLIAGGIADTCEAAKKEMWILDKDAYQLGAWLRLLPFASPVSDVPAIVRGLPDAQRTPHLLEEMVGGLCNSPYDEAEAVLFQIAEDDPRFYQNHDWRATAMRLDTTSAARRLIDLTASGVLGGESFDDWHWRRQLGGLIAEFPDVRAYVRELLRDGPTTKHLALLARTLAEVPDGDDLVMLVEFEIKTGRSFLGWQSIQNAVTVHVPSEHWRGAYNVVPVPAVELRSKLLAMTSGEPKDPAVRCLDFIDKVRDDYGAPESEPRHPDLASGRQWPILVPDPDATDE